MRPPTHHGGRSGRARIHTPGRDVATPTSGPVEVMRRADQPSAPSLLNRAASSHWRLWAGPAQTLAARPESASIARSSVSRRFAKQNRTCPAPSAGSL